MKLYIFSDQHLLNRIHAPIAQIRETLHRIGAESDTRDLVVGVYLVEGKTWAGGTAYARTWLTPTSFTTRRGNWKITSQHATPDDLPSRFKLIRLLPIAHYRPYPRIQKDGYGWQFRYDTFLDHLALLFAHELHHFRRFHLGFHPGEGEKSANRWALAHARLLGYKVTGRFVDQAKERRQRQKRQKKRHSFFKSDPFQKFRILENGSKVMIKYDPRGTYQNAIGVVERPIRANSKRMVIRTSDEKIWRWPMDWLQPL